MDSSVFFSFFSVYRRIFTEGLSCMCTVADSNFPHYPRPLTEGIFPKIWWFYSALHLRPWGEVAFSEISWFCAHSSALPSPLTRIQLHYHLPQRGGGIRQNAWIFPASSGILPASVEMGERSPECLDLVSSSCAPPLTPAGREISLDRNDLVAISGIPPPTSVGRGRSPKPNSLPNSGTLPLPLGAGGAFVRA